MDEFSKKLANRYLKKEQKKIKRKVKKKIGKKLKEVLKGGNEKEKVKRLLKGLL